MAAKDLAAYEKQEVQLNERKKHANSKAKKAKKSLHDVRYALYASPNFGYSNGHMM